MVDIAAQKIAEAHRWAAMHIKANRIHEFDAEAQKILRNKARYQGIEAHLVSIGKGVPWWFVGVVDVREGGGNCAHQLGQGDPLDRVSTHEPADRGPFHGPDGFERSCYDALIDCAPHAALNTDWTIGGTLTVLIKYNGEGYTAMGKPSPYIWAGTDQYSHGKYISDGHYSDSAVDTQPGCAPLIARLMALDPSIKFADAPGKWTAAPVQTKPKAPPKVGAVVVAGAGAAGAAHAAGWHPSLTVAAILLVVVIAFAAWQAFKAK